MVFQAETGRLVGPHESAEGEHWFRVIDRFAGTDAPRLDAIREQVRFDWMALREEALLAVRVAELRRRYRVQFTGALSPSAGRGGTEKREALEVGQMRTSSVDGSVR